jgi:flagellar hook protein FlgE
VASEVSTIQSLKAVDAWIDVINANINGGVRTAFKSSRLKFSGSNTDVQRAGSSTSLPLQFPEPGLTTANTVIDFTQGAITASTETAHLAIQGEGFFVLADPSAVLSTGLLSAPTASTKMYLTRDGEFRTDSRGFLVHSSGFVLMVPYMTAGVLHYSTGVNGAPSGFRAVYNDIDNKTVPTTGGTAYAAIRLSDFIPGKTGAANVCADGTSPYGLPITNTVKVTLGKQSLQYSTLGSTVYEFGYNFATGGFSSQMTLQQASSADNTILSKSLEASNASMTQSVPELSLAQKLFSALTKVLQTKQTNVDGVLNLVR